MGLTIPYKRIQVNLQSPLKTMGGERKCKLKMVETGEKMQVEPSAMYFDMPMLFLKGKEAPFFIPQKFSTVKQLALTF